MTEEVSQDAMLDLSVVVPVFNERDSIALLLQEIVAALHDKYAFEIVYVDDHSTDDTIHQLQDLRLGIPQLRILRQARRCGQSTAIRAGVIASRAPWIATLDGDGQNDPLDIQKLLHARACADTSVKLFAGWRVDRRDNVSKRWASILANTLRSRLLRDHTPDTGCGIKLFERAAFLELPYFSHMHRFLPALMQRAGWRTQSIAVTHRPRCRGTSKYDNWNRFWVGIADLGGVAWLIKRSSITTAQEL